MFDRRLDFPELVSPITAIILISSSIIFQPQLLSTLALVMAMPVMD
jgi:hypothetical protein